MSVLSHSMTASSVEDVFHSHGNEETLQKTGNKMKNRRKNLQSLGSDANQDYGR